MNSKVNADVSVESIAKLKQTIQTIDSFSQSGFSEIASIAKLALVALESPDAYLHFENIANALLAIRNKAVDIEDCINSEAEDVGCNYSCQHTERRTHAYLAARGH